MENLSELVHIYFRLGFAHQEVLEALAHRHGIVISIRTLKRVLCRMRLYRRKQKSNILHIALFIAGLLTGYSSLHGYRSVHSTCVRNGYIVSREDVRLLLSILDPEGVIKRSTKKLRRRQYYAKGPNSVWHIDGYDKLKPYGLCISGGIDGYSRHVMWLAVFSTNNNPKVIAGYYMEAVNGIGGAPAIIRADMGTENTLVDVLQTLLVGENTFRYGRSTTNQRIESWWAFLRKHFTQYWMDILEDIKDDGSFTGDMLDKALIQYCFTSIVQENLDEIVTSWNSHRIRPSTNERVPHGRPMVVYNMPALYGVQDYKHQVDGQQIDICNRECTFRQCPCDETVYNLCEMYVTDLQLAPPSNAADARLLYITLRNCIKQDLDSGQ